MAENYFNKQPLFMKTMFQPIFTITSKIAQILIKLEAIRQEINHLPLTSSVLKSLRETAHFNSVHYSTMIEGNRLTERQVIEVIKDNKKFLGRERDEKEILGYYVALEYVEKTAQSQKKVTEKSAQTIHALVMAAGKTKVKPTAYRTGQNFIKDSRTGKIVYLPPEAHDVPTLMKELILWLNQTLDTTPCPIRAAIAHYQFATIHPYYDGNGRTARLLTTLTLHQCNYDLKGIYSLDEYYAQDLLGYYEAISIGASHNYYFGRAEADITSWILYFCNGMLESFEKVKKQALLAAHKKSKDNSSELRKLTPRQRAALTLFEDTDIITSADIVQLFKIQPRTARTICEQWANEGFLIIVDPAKKSRKYSLAPKFKRDITT